jgi:transposase-like protein
MASRMFSSEQKAKLTQLVNEGISIMQEVEDLNGGLNDTIKAVAEEMEIKPSLLKKAIKIAQKSGWTDAQASHSDLEDILSTVGRLL